jgi:gliding motility-associated-like protein
VGGYSVLISVDNVSGIETHSITDTVTIKEYCPYSLFIPNTFTPNGNSLNEVFYAYGNNIVSFQMFVFDRWGLQVFESNDINHGWNGVYKSHDAQQDVYVWKIKYKVGTEEVGIIELSEIGHVNLIRHYITT